MGTLFEQQPRQDTLDSYIGTVEQLAHRYGLNKTAADWHAACDIVRTALALQSADALDEQLAGFGNILQTLAEVLQGNER